MINKYEAIGIFVSVSLMALTLFLLNFQSVTEQLSPSIQTDATVVLSEENPFQDLYNSVEPNGDIAKLVIDDVVVGSGAAAAAGDTVSVHYIGTLTDGTAFDNSYVKGAPFTFTLGEGQVIAGWEEGVAGMKVGGQRILVIPAEKAYGERAIGPIPANADLVFAIELLSINAK